MSSYAYSSYDSRLCKLWKSNDEPANQKPTLAVWSFSGFLLSAGYKEDSKEVVTTKDLQNSLKRKILTDLKRKLQVQTNPSVGFENNTETPNAKWCYGRN